MKCLSKKNIFYSSSYFVWRATLKSMATYEKIYSKSQLNAICISSVYDDMSSDMSRTGLPLQS